MHTYHSHDYDAAGISNLAYRMDGNDVQQIELDAPRGPPSQLMHAHSHTHVHHPHAQPKLPRPQPHQQPPQQQAAHRQHPHPQQQPHQSQQSQAGPHSRTRKAHVRTFTGCAQCRKRHVKCDEGRPKCDNCARMGLECEGYPFRIDMKIFTPESMAKARKKPVSPASLAASSSTAAAGTGRGPGDKQANSATGRRRSSGQLVTGLRHEVQEIDEEGEPVPGQIVLHPMRADLRLQHRLVSSDSRYLNHFLGTVSKLLIVYDLPYNANPYRFVFPKLAASSEPLQEAMNALGALHLAQTTPQETELRATAIQKYSGSVNSLRQTLTTERQPRLAHLATILLLTFYEMMDSGSTAGWRLHLKGARDVFERLFSADTTHQRDDPHFAAAKDFLISCLTYLDMAAAVSTGQPTLIRGNYWDKVGGGWQYNLGVPSVQPGVARRDEDARLEEVRHTWSRLMLIQSDVGGLNVALESGDLHASQSRRDHVQAQLEDWQRSLPPLFIELDGPGVDADVVEGASCVLVYAAATFIYFHQVSGTFSTDDGAELDGFAPYAVFGQQQQQRPTTDSKIHIGLFIAPETAPHLSVAQRLRAAVDFILANFERFGRGSNGFGMLWAFFIAGTQLADPLKQSYVSEKLSAMTAYGFGNVGTALELLRLVWQRRAKNAERVASYRAGLVQQQQQQRQREDLDMQRRLSALSSTISHSRPGSVSLPTNVQAMSSPAFAAAAAPDLLHHRSSIASFFDGAPGNAGGGGSVNVGQFEQASSTASLQSAFDGGVTSHPLSGGIKAEIDHDAFYHPMLGVPVGVPVGDGVLGDGVLIGSGMGGSRVGDVDIADAAAGQQAFRGGFDPQQQQQHNIELPPVSLLEERWWKVQEEIGRPVFLP